MKTAKTVRFSIDIRVIVPEGSPEEIIIKKATLELKRLVNTENLADCAVSINDSLQSYDPLDDA